MPSLAPILEKLDSTRSNLLLAADRVSPDQWQKSPGAGAWSVAEVIAHLTMVERAVREGADRIVQHPPKPVPFLRQFHAPVALAAWRGIRRKTPIPLDASLLSEKEAMLAELRAGRERTLAFLQEIQDKDLRAYRWPHPFFGSLNFYEWFRMIAHHERRHTKQILEIVEKLQ